MLKLQICVDWIKFGSSHNNWTARKVLLNQADKGIHAVAWS